MRISGFVIVSEPERLNYPYLEAIRSFLPICDEIIVVCNTLESFQDGSLEKIKQIDDKVQAIGGVFNYEKYGWLSQGLMRSSGYYACTGDVVLMFDADDILHEKDIELLKSKLETFKNDNHLAAFWRRYKFRQRENYTLQCKYPGVFNKRLLKNNFNFYGAYLAEANWSLLPEKYRVIDLEFYLYGYEKLWENYDTYKYNLLNGKLDNFPEGAINREFTGGEYIRNWINNTRDKIKTQGKFMPINKQPLIIQEKLTNMTQEQFGFDNFGGLL